MSMGIHFSSPTGGLVLRNESATVIFAAMGWDDAPSGSRSLLEARLGVNRAKTILQGRELTLVIALEMVVDELSESGEDLLEWA